MLSIVIPVHNEERSILPLYDRLTSVLDQVQRPYEILFVDDASTDRSFDLLANLVETDGHLKVIRLRRNFGQTAALSAGFHEAQGEVIIAMDGDLQHAPEDIPALLKKIDEGFDIASGWRQHRVDNAIMRKIPSRIANWLMAKASGIELRDFGTTFKAYRAEVLKDVNLYGELHRFIPALASFYGARIVGGAHPQYAALGGRFALRHRPHVPRDVRHPDHQVSVEVLHPSDALLRPAGPHRDDARRRHHGVPAVRQTAGARPRRFLFHINHGLTRMDTDKKARAAQTLRNGTNSCSQIRNTMTKFSPLMSKISQREFLPLPARNERGEVRGEGGC